MPLLTITRASSMIYVLRGFDHWSCYYNTANYTLTFIYWNGYNFSRHSTVWDCRVLRAGPMIFYSPTLLSHFLSSTVFIFSYFVLWVGVVLYGLGSSD